MSYKTELQELRRELTEINIKKRKIEKEFAVAARSLIADSFPFGDIQKTIYGIKLPLSTNGKFKCSKTMTYDNLFLGDVTFRLYHEKGQRVKYEKAKKSIEKLYKGEDDERD